MKLKKSKIPVAAMADVTISKSSSGVLGPEAVSQVMVESSTGTASGVAKDNAMVGMDAGLTINLGDFNSVRFGVTLHMPCDPNQVEETFVGVQEWVDNKLRDMRDELET